MKREREGERERQRGRETETETERDRDLKSDTERQFKPYPAIKNEFGIESVGRNYRA